MNKIDNLNNKKLEVSASALEQMKKILFSEKEGNFIRLSVDSGGCSGFSYNFIVDNKLNKEKDIYIIKDSEKIILVSDKVSLSFIKNSSIDWVETLTQAQFSIDNPIAKSKCGCGSSFSI